ncbi:MAG: hypothetical protein ACK6AD_06860 [Cyanobacteriota bacterium]|jgi:hypothetical protein
MPSPSSYQIVRSDGQQDRIAGRLFSSYDEAYDLLEDYYRDACCSDGSLLYRIVAIGVEAT